MGKMATKPCNPGGPQSGEEIRIGYKSLVVIGAHLCAKGLHNFYRPGAPQCVEGETKMAT